MNCKDVEELITGYLDGELTQQDVQRVRIHLDECKNCAKISRDLRQVKEKMGQLSYPETDLEALEHMEGDVLSQAGQWTGWLLVVIGALFFAGIALQEYFTAPDVPLYFRIFFGGTMFGLLILFITVLRQRLMVYKNDKYRKVKL